MKLTIKAGSIVALNVDAIVNPANSYGYMGGGVALALKEAGGEIIEEEAISQAPCNVGEVIITTSGDLVAGHIIHAPVMQELTERCTLDKVHDALLAALEKAEGEGFRTLAIPGMGTGVGLLNKSEVAHIMLNVINKFPYVSIKEIILVDLNEDMVTAWNAEAKRFIDGVGPLHV